MDANKINEINGMIKRHQAFVSKDVRTPAGHGQADEDLSKVASSDVIGKTVEHETDLRK